MDFETKWKWVLTFGLVVAIVAGATWWLKFRDLQGVNPMLEWWPRGVNQRLEGRSTGKVDIKPVGPGEFSKDEQRMLREAR